MIIERYNFKLGNSGVLTEFEKYDVIEGDGILSYDSIQVQNFSFSNIEKRNLQKSLF